MREITIEVPGRPVPAARMTTRGKFKSRQAQRYLAYKRAVGWTAKAAGVKPVMGPLTVEIEVYLHRGQDGDWDNYGKSICDGLNGVAYVDDSQIIDGRVRKLRARGRHEERAVIHLREAPLEAL